MTDNFEVAKWSHPVEVAEAPCGTCGQTVLYNLAAKVVVHAPAAFDPCDAPWPNEPRPAWVTAQIEQAEADMATLRRWADSRPTASAPAFGLEPHHAAARQRTDDESAALTPRFATGGVVAADSVRSDSGDDRPIRVRLSGGSVPPGLAEFFGADTLARIKEVRPTAAFFEGEATR